MFACLAFVAPLALTQESQLLVPEPDAEPSAASALAWQSTPLDGLSTAWEATEPVTNALTGEVTTQEHRFIEVASGLNYLDPTTGQFQPSQDLIELTADGGAAAVHGPAKLYVQPNLNTDAAITIVTVSNRLFQIRPLGLFFYDSQSGRAQLLAPVQDCVGELVPPNQVVWKSAFGPLADLRLTYTKSAIESDVMLRQQPILPDGWDPQTTRLEVWHEQTGCPAPGLKARLLHSEEDPALRARMTDPDFTDQMLDFGDLWFPTGAAYATAGARASARGAPRTIRVPSVGGATGLVPVANPSILTSPDDLLFGGRTVPITYSCPTYAASRALLSYFINGNVTLSGLRIRWAQTGVWFESSGCGTNTHTVANSKFEFCQTGIYENNGNLVINNSTRCEVATPTSSHYGCTSINGYLLDVGTNDADYNGVVDSDDYKYFGGLGTLQGHEVGRLTARTAGHNVNTDQVIWSTRDDANAIYVFNPNCWLAGVQGLTAFSPWHTPFSGAESYQGGGTLITRRHAITAQHINFPAGTHVRFAGTDGTHEVVCLGSRVVSGDLGVMVFDQDLPISTVGFVPVTPPPVGHKLTPTLTPDNALYGSACKSGPTSSSSMTSPPTATRSPSCFRTRTTALPKPPMAPRRSPKRRQPGLNRNTALCGPMAPFAGCWTTARPFVMKGAISAA